ncbi:MAG: hypothetical protein HY554_01810 [Elusimicrobia bacterium]|nr:hypothetical protein [Elusimicrobiota bacterium]
MAGIRPALGALSLSLLLAPAGWTAPAWKAGIGPLRQLQQALRGSPAAAAAPWAPLVGLDLDDPLQAARAKPVLVLLAEPPAGAVDPAAAMDAVWDRAVVAVRQRAAALVASAYTEEQTVPLMGIAKELWRLRQFHALYLEDVAAVERAYGQAAGLLVERAADMAERRAGELLAEFERSIRDDTLSGLGVRPGEARGLVSLALVLPPSGPGLPPSLLEETLAQVNGAGQPTLARERALARFAARYLDNFLAAIRRSRPGRRYALIVPASLLPALEPSAGAREAAASGELALLPVADLTEGISLVNRRDVEIGVLPAVAFDGSRLAARFPYEPDRPEIMLTQLVADSGEATAPAPPRPVLWRPSSL